MQVSVHALILSLVKPSGVIGWYGVAWEAAEKPCNESENKSETADGAFVFTSGFCCWFYFSHLMLVSIGPFNGCMCEQWIERMGCAVMHGLTITCDSTAVRDPWNGAVAASRLRGELRQLSRSPKCTSRQNCSSTWNSVSMAVKNPMDAQLNAAHSPLPTMSLVPMT